jgi:hypothetical protein
MWCIARRWLNMSKDSTKWLLDMHQGTDTGSPVVYTLAVAIPTCFLLIR